MLVHELDKAYMFKHPSPLRTHGAIGEILLDTGG
jgi:hypothetical protein